MIVLTDFVKHKNNINTWKITTTTRYTIDAVRRCVCLCVSAGTAAIGLRRGAFRSPRAAPAYRRRHRRKGLVNRRPRTRPPRRPIAVDSPSVGSSARRCVLSAGTVGVQPYRQGHRATLRRVPEPRRYNICWKLNIISLH